MRQRKLFKKLATVVLATSMVVGLAPASYSTVKAEEVTEETVINDAGGTTSGGATEVDYYEDLEKNLYHYYGTDYVNKKKGYADGYIREHKKKYGVVVATWDYDYCNNPLAVEGLGDKLEYSSDWERIPVEGQVYGKNVNGELMDADDYVYPRCSYNFRFRIERYFSSTSDAWEEKLTEYLKHYLYTKLIDTIMEDEHCTREQAENFWNYGVAEVVTEYDYYKTYYGNANAEREKNSSEYIKIKERYAGYGWDYDKYLDYRLEHPLDDITPSRFPLDKPEATQEPTKKPEATQEPTKVPEVTTTPEVTIKPEVTTEPTKEPEVTTTPSATPEGVTPSTSPSTKPETEVTPSTSPSTQPQATSPSVSPSTKPSTKPAISTPTKAPAKAKTIKVSSLKAKKNTKVITGKAIKGATVKVKIGTKTYKAKANSKGKFTIKVKKLKKGQKYTLTVTCKGYTKYKKTLKVK